MTDVLPGVWFGSLASVIEYISGLTGGIRLTPLCPLGKSSGIGAAAEMTDDFPGVYIHSTIIDDGSAQKRSSSVVRIRSSDGAMTGLLAGTRQTNVPGLSLVSAS